MEHSSQLKTKHFFVIFLVFSTLWDQGQPKRVRMSSSVALSICEQQTQFTDTSEIQPPVKKRPDSHAEVPCSWYKHPECSSPDQPDSCTVAQKPCDAGGEGKKGRTAAKAGGSKALAVKGDINDIETDFQEDEFGIRQGRFLGSLVGGLIGAAAGVVGGLIGAAAGVVGGLVGAAAGIVDIKKAILGHITGHLGHTYEKIVDLKEKIIGGVIAKIKWLVGVIFNVLGQLLLDPKELVKCIIRLICTVVDKWSDGKGVLVAARGEIAQKIGDDVKYIVDKITNDKQKVIEGALLRKDIRKRCKKIVETIIAIKKGLIKAITDKLSSLIEKIINLKQKIIDAFVEKLKWLCTLIFGADGSVIVTPGAIIGAIFDIICAIIDKLLNLAGAFFNVKWALITFLKEKLVWLVTKIIELKGKITEIIGKIGELISAIIESKWELIASLGEKLDGCFTIECVSCKNCKVCPAEPKLIKCKKNLGCGTFYNDDGTVDRGCFHRYWKPPGCYTDFTKCKACNPNPGNGGNTTYCKCNTDKCNAKGCEEDDDGGPDQP